MSEESWVFVERFAGQLRRVTVLDDRFHVIATHERAQQSGVPDPVDGLPDDCQLLKAVALERFD